MYLHIAGYHFFKLNDPESLRSTLMPIAEDLNLKGSLIVSHEGINLYLTGLIDSVRRFQNFLHQEAKIPKIKYNESFCQEHAYKRLLFKFKNEIVTTGLNKLNVSEQTGPSIEPKELKKWLDEGKDITLLDTRNDYEIDLGKFNQAIDLDVANFREFSEKASEIPSAAKQKPLVMYCTGGIRCEKASAQLLSQLGFNEVYKLKGGILNYLKECDGETHWQGDCFVFDSRVAVDKNLKETGAQMCLACDWPITKDLIEQGPYKEGVYCPKCFPINGKYEVLNKKTVRKLV